MILGFLWLAVVNPLISFSDATWRHPIEYWKLEVLSVKKFVKVTKEEPYIFILISAPTKGS